MKSWFKLSSEFFDDPRVQGLTPEAITLWLHMAAWCSRNCEEFVLPMLPRVSSVPEPAVHLSALVGAGLVEWHDDGEFYTLVEDGLWVCPVGHNNFGPIFPPDGITRPTMPARLRATILDRDGHACRACGSTDDLQIDHVIPLCMGGDFYDETNLQVLCKPCNCSKGGRI